MHLLADTDMNSILEDEAVFVCFGGSEYPHMSRKKIVEIMSVCLMKLMLD